MARPKIEICEAETERLARMAGLGLMRQPCRSWTQHLRWRH